MKKALWLCVLLTGCQTLDDVRVDLPQSFERQANVIRLETPTWRVPSSVYDLPLGEYQVDGSDVSWTSIDSELIDIQYHENLLGFLLFGDDLTVLRKTFQESRHQRFRFTLKHQQQQVTTSRCDIYSLGTSDEVISRHEDSRAGALNSLEDRARTWLYCNIDDGKTQWALSFQAVPDRPISAALVSDGKVYEITGLNGASASYKGDDSGKNVHLPPWASRQSGMGFYQGKDMLAAVSLMENSYIWTLQGADDAQQALFLTAGYSLVMFNWLDEDWRQVYLKNSDM